MLATPEQRAGKIVIAMAEGGGRVPHADTIAAEIKAAQVEVLHYAVQEIVRSSSFVVSPEAAQALSDCAARLLDRFAFGDLP